MSRVSLVSLVRALKIVGCEKAEWQGCLYPTANDPTYDGPIR